MVAVTERSVPVQIEHGPLGYICELVSYLGAAIERMQVNPGRYMITEVVAKIPLPGAAILRHHRSKDLSLPFGQTLI